MSISFEFKLDGTADEALCQIEDKGYAREYSSDARRVFKIGASFSSETGTIADWKVRIELSPLQQIWAVGFTMT